MKKNSADQIEGKIMIKKCLCLAFICLLLITANSPAVTAQTGTNNTASSIAKIKTYVLKRGTGEDKRVEVKMLDGKKLKGYISQAGEDSFTLTDAKTSSTSVIAYSDVAKVKKPLSGDTIALIIIGSAAAVAGVVLGSFLIRRCRNEGGCL